MNLDDTSSSWPGITICLMKMYKWWKKTRLTVKTQVPGLVLYPVKKIYPPSTFTWVNRISCVRCTSLLVHLDLTLTSSDTFGKLLHLSDFSLLISKIRLTIVHNILLDSGSKLHWNYSININYITVIIMPVIINIFNSH